MGRGVVGEAGAPAMSAFDALIAVIRSRDLRELTRRLVRGEVSDDQPGRAEITAQRTLDWDLSNLVLRDPRATRLVVVTVRPLSPPEVAAIDDPDDRDPFPPPYQWRVATVPVTQWELFNCEVVRIAIRSP